MPTPLRYLLFQIPGLFMASLALGALVHWGGLSTGLAAALLLIWVLKDALLYPFVKHAYSTRYASPTDGLLGTLGIAREDLDPEGYVRVGAELWRARVAKASAPIPAGSPVRVVAVRNFTLLVESAGEKPGEAA